MAIKKVAGGKKSKKCAVLKKEPTVAIAPPSLDRVKGLKYALDIDVDGKVIRADFIAGKGKVVDLGNGFVVMSGEVIFNNGAHAYCVLTICEQDSGEHYNTGIMLPAYGNVPAKITFQDDRDFLLQMRRFGLSRNDVFPYKYRYYGRLDNDHHVGADGWSGQTNAASQ